MRNTQKSALMAEGKPRSPKSPTKELSVTSEEEEVNPTHKTSKEERHYGTIHSSALATDSTQPFQGTNKPNHQKRTQL